MKDVIACVDYSDSTTDVVEAAAALSSALGVNLFLLHVVVIKPTSLESGATLISPQAVAEKMAEARSAMEDVARPLVRRGVKVTPLVLEEYGTTVDSILNECAKIKPGFVVMGSHGHGALYRLLMGSVAEGVIRKLHCPVLLVPHRVASKEAGAATLQGAGSP